MHHFIEFNILKIFTWEKNIFFNEWREQVREEVFLVILIINEAIIIEVNHAMIKACYKKSTRI